MGRAGRLYVRIKKYDDAVSDHDHDHDEDDDGLDDDYDNMDDDTDKDENGQALCSHQEI